MKKSMLAVALALGLGVVVAPAAARADVTCSIVEIEASSGSAPSIDPELKALERKFKRPPLSSWNVFKKLGGASLTLAPGSLLVFDPARVSLQCEPPTADVLQMFVLPRLPAEATQVVRLSKAAWPADPFRVVATGERAVPRIARRWREIAGRTVATSA